MTLTRYLLILLFPFSLFSQNLSNIDSLKDISSKYHSHANLYFWYATESHHQLKYYQKAEDFIRKSNKIIIDYKLNLNSTESEDLLRQNNAMLDNIEEIKGINKDNLNGIFPLYNELMSNTPHKVVVDEASELSIEASIEAAGSQLKGSKAIFDLTYFTVIESNYQDPGMIEVMRQAVSEASTHYVISNHELQRIVGKNIGYNGFSNQDLDNLCNEFNTPQIGVLRVDLQDSIDGIYYNSCSFSLYESSSDKKKQIAYAEAFRHNQKKNKWHRIEFVFYLFFLIVILFFVKRNPSIPGWRQYFSLSVFLSFCLSLILLSGVRLYPISASDFYQEPNSIIFWSLLTFSFSIAPILLSYIASMRLKFYPEIIENINKPKSLISIVFGACFGSITSIISLQIAEDGISSYFYYHIIAIILLFIPSYCTGKIASQYFLNQKKSDLISVALNLFLIFVVYSLLFLDLKQDEILIFSKNLFLLFVLISILLLSILSLYFDKIACYFSSKSSIELNKSDSDIFETPPFVAPNSRIANRFENIVSDSNIYDEKLLKVNLIIGEKGSGKTRLIHEIMDEKLSDALTFFGDCDKETSSIDYEPFVEAFSSHLGKGVFTDQASQAKLIGGKLAESGIFDAVPGGKVLEQISSAGEQEVRDASYIINEILAYLKKQKKNIIICIDDINNIDDDSLELLSSLIYEIGVNYTEFNHISFILSSNINLDDSESNLSFLNELAANEIIEKEVWFENLSDDLKNFTSLLLRKLNIEYESERVIEEFITNEQKVDEPVNVITILRLINSFKLFDKKGKLSLVKNADLSILPIDKHTTGIYTEKINDLDVELFNILECASYIGKTFEANVIVHIIGKDRLEILNRLREAEDMGLVIDKNDEDDIYEFTSRSLIKELRSHSIKKKGISKDDKITVSQIVKEYNNRIIDYFYSSEDFDINDIDLNLLISLSNRSFENNYHRKTYNPRCFELNEVAGNRALKLGRYKDAKGMYSNLFKLASRFLDQDQVARIEENLNELKIKNLLHVVECSLLLNDINAAKNELDRLDEKDIRNPSLKFEKDLFTAKVNLEEGNDDDAYLIANKLLKYNNLKQVDKDEILLILAQIHDNKDEDDEALKIYMEIYDSLQEDNLKKANILSKICDIHVQHDDIEKAKDLANTGLSISEKLNNKFSISDFLYELTLIAMRENDVDAINHIKEKSTILKNNNFSCSKNELTFFLCDLATYLKGNYEYSTLIKSIIRLKKIFAYKKDIHRENQIILIELLVNILRNGEYRDSIMQIKDLIADKRLVSDFRLHALFVMLYTDLTILLKESDFSYFNDLDSDKIKLIPTLVPKFNFLKEMSDGNPIKQSKSTFIDSIKHEKHTLILEEFPFSLKETSLTDDDKKSISNTYFANEKLNNFFNN